MEYICLKIETTAEAADIVGLILIEEGSEGVSFNGGCGLAELESLKKETYWDYVDEGVIKEYAEYAASDANERVFVMGYFTKDKDLTEVERRLDEFKNAAEMPTGSLELTLTITDSAEYENEWKKYYTVTEFESVAIVPAWLPYDGALPAVRINPGKAFGTGMHETTAMCLSLLDCLQNFHSRLTASFRQDEILARQVRSVATPPPRKFPSRQKSARYPTMLGFASSLLSRVDIAGKDVLDVGCGSGILGLAALVLGAKGAILTDIDPQAIEAATENAVLNGLEADIRLCDLTQGAGDNTINSFCDFTADVIFANLTADILLKLRPQIPKLLKKGGRLILSGVIEGRAAEIEAAYSDFELLERLHRGSWFAYLYK